MPKLDAIQILEHLQIRLKDLEAGKEIPAKDIRALLTPAQLQQLNAAWALQEQLRKLHRPRTEEDKQALGWTTKREVRIEVFKSAVDTAWKNLPAYLKEMQRQKEIKQTRVYFDTYGAAIEAQKNRSKSIMKH